MARRNSKGRNIDGVILLDKVVGPSSNKALQQVKRLFDAKKAGHTGSLDPMASGILPICFGQATKVAQFLLADDKRYFVRAQLGQTTDTGDVEGNIVARLPFQHLKVAQIRAAISQFVGDILQVPPMYSALKKDGKPLYKLARQGIQVARKARPVRIDEINYLGYEGGILSVDVRCSKGTYIRSLIEDIGNKLGCGAHVIELRRTGFAQFDISQSIKFSQLEKLRDNDSSLAQKLFPTEAILPNFTSVYLNASQSVEIKFGRSIAVDRPYPLEKVKLFDEKKQFLGIGETRENDTITISPIRLFV